MSEKYEQIQDINSFSLDQLAKFDNEDISNLSFSDQTTEQARNESESQESAENPTTTLDQELSSKITSQLQNFLNNLKRLGTNTSKVPQWKQITKDIQSPIDLGKINEDTIQNYLSLSDQVPEENYPYIAENFKQILYTHLTYNPHRKGYLTGGWATGMKIEGIVGNNNYTTETRKRLQQIEKKSESEQRKDIINKLDNPALVDLWLKKNLAKLAEQDENNRNKERKYISDPHEQETEEPTLQGKFIESFLNEIPFDKLYVYFTSAEQSKLLKDLGNALIYEQAKKENLIIENCGLLDLLDKQQKLKCYKLASFSQHINFEYRNEKDKFTFDKWVNYSDSMITNYKTLLKDPNTGIQYLDKKLLSSKEGWAALQSFIKLAQDVPQQIENINQQKSYELQHNTAPVMSPNGTRSIGGSGFIESGTLDIQKKNLLLSYEKAYVNVLLHSGKRPQGGIKGPTGLPLKFNKGDNVEDIVRDSFWENIEDGRDKFLDDRKNDTQSAVGAIGGLIGGTIGTGVMAALTCGSNPWLMSAGYTVGSRLGNGLTQEAYNTTERILQQCGVDIKDNEAGVGVVDKNGVQRPGVSFLRGIGWLDNDYQEVGWQNFFIDLGFDYLSGVASFGLSNKVFGGNVTGFLKNTTKEIIQEFALENMIFDNPAEIMKSGTRAFFNTKGYENNAGVVNTMINTADECYSIENLTTTFLHTVSSCGALGAMHRPLNYINSRLTKPIIDAKLPGMEEQIDNKVAALFQAIRENRWQMKNKEILDQTTGKPLDQNSKAFKDFQKQLKAVNELQNKYLTLTKEFNDEMKKKMKNPNDPDGVKLKYDLISPFDTPMNILTEKMKIAKKGLEDAQKEGNTEKIQQYEDLLQEYEHAQEVLKGEDLSGEKQIKNKRTQMQNQLGFSVSNEELQEINLDTLITLKKLGARITENDRKQRNNTSRDLNKITRLFDIITPPAIIFLQTLKNLQEQEIDIEKLQQIKNLGLKIDKNDIKELNNIDIDLDWLFQLHNAGINLNIDSYTLTKALKQRENIDHTINLNYISTIQKELSLNLTPQNIINLAKTHLSPQELGTYKTFFEKNGITENHEKMFFLLTFNNTSKETLKNFVTRKEEYLEKNRTLTQETFQELFGGKGKYGKTEIQQTGLGFCYTYTAFELLKKTNGFDELIQTNVRETKTGREVRLPFSDPNGKWIQINKDEIDKKFTGQELLNDLGGISLNDKPDNNNRAFSINSQSDYLGFKILELAWIKKHLGDQGLKVTAENILRLEGGYTENMIGEILPDNYLILTGVHKITDETKNIIFDYFNTGLYKIPVNTEDIDINLKGNHIHKVSHDIIGVGILVDDVIIHNQGNKQNGWTINNNGEISINKNINKNTSPQDIAQDIVQNEHGKNMVIFAPNHAYSIERCYTNQETGEKRVRIINPRNTGIKFDISLEQAKTIFQRNVVGINIDQMFREDENNTNHPPFEKFSSKKTFEIPIKNGKIEYQKIGPDGNLTDIKEGEITEQEATQCFKNGMKVTGELFEGYTNRSILSSGSLFLNNPEYSKLGGDIDVATDEATFKAIALEKQANGETKLEHLVKMGKIRDLTFTTIGSHAHLTLKEDGMAEYYDEKTKTTMQEPLDTLIKRGDVRVEFNIIDKNQNIINCEFFAEPPGYGLIQLGTPRTEGKVNSYNLDGVTIQTVNPELAAMSYIVNLAHEFKSNNLNKFIKEDGRLKLKDSIRINNLFQYLNDAGIHTVQDLKDFIQQTIDNYNSQRGETHIVNGQEINQSQYLKAGLEGLTQKDGVLDFLNHLQTTYEMLKKNNENGTWKMRGSNIDHNLTFNSFIKETYQIKTEIYKLYTKDIVTDEEIQQIYKNIEDLMAKIDISDPKNFAYYYEITTCVEKYYKQLLAKAYRQAS